MKRFLMNLTAVVIFLTLAAPGGARAQSFFGGDDPMLVLPEVLTIIDSSGSMIWGLYPGFAPCIDDDGDFYVDGVDFHSNDDGKLHVVAQYYGGTYYYFPCDVYQCVTGGRICKNFYGYYCHDYGTTPWSRGDGLTCFRNRIESAKEILTGSYLDGNHTCSNQDTNGILDLYSDLIRFGYSSFDNDEHRTSWDYGDDLGTHQRMGIKDRCPCDGIPNSGPDCSCVTDGRLIDLVDPAEPDNIIGNNARAQSEVCQMTADMGTPLAPALYDARYYYSHWQEEVDYDDPLNACRPRFVLLMSDGEENSGSGSATYHWGHDQAAALCAAGIPVFVVGYGDAGLAGNLNSIANAGTGPACASMPLNAFMADNPADLYVAFQAIMNAILSGSASRTVVSSSPSQLSQEDAYVYSSHFEAGITDLGWRGHVVRTKVTDIDRDGIPEWHYGTQIDFADVLHDQSPANRDIYTVVNDPRSQDPVFDYPDHMPRPVDATDPDVGLYPFEAGKHASDPAMCLSDTEGLGNDALSDLIKNYVRGVSGAYPLGGIPLLDGHPTLGDVFHSNQVAVPPPTVMAPDYKYEQYFLNNRDRNTMLFVGANDGMLHAFVGEDSHGGGRDGQEAWAFIPNNLLAKIQKVRWGHEFFVDGSPIIRDVFFDDFPMTDTTGAPILDGSNHPILGAYRTVLISGERGGGSAYFALDVTDPDNPQYLWEYRTDVDVHTDYEDPDVQCKPSRLQTWAKPIVGRVWLKNKHAGEGTPPELLFVSRSVAIFPGGYLPPQSLTNVTSCIDFVEMLASAASLHVVDVETGKLLRRFIFSNAITQAYLDKVKEFHDLQDAGSTANWDGIFEDPNYNMPDGWGWGNDKPPKKPGWFCREFRENIQNDVQFPAELQANCDITDNEERYQMQCCWQGGTPVDPKTCNPNSVGGCFYSYTKWKGIDGALQIKLKGVECKDLPISKSGKFRLSIGEDFRLETSAASPVAYNQALGEYITRVFASTTVGKIWRINMNSAEYDRDKPEGEMVYLFSDPDTGKDHDWDVGRDAGGDPLPWYNTGVNRPIMVQPSQAMNYKRNLVLFFGTGVMDDLTYHATQDRFYAVEETRTLTADGFYDPDPEGKLFCNESLYGATCAGSGNPLDLATAERLFGKPLVVGGKVLFSTYTPDSDLCKPGTGVTYGMDFDNFQENGLISDPPTEGPPHPIDIVWTAAGPKAVTGKPGDEHSVDFNIVVGAQVMHWGKVL
ncbi:MAG TPA: PilC/PilY family type IV pilus protein [Myxococcota bacterium]|nr:PilC/PilY family type IV pilus protein [Myxococcota bacterium]